MLHYRKNASKNMTIRNICSKLSRSLIVSSIIKCSYDFAGRPANFVGVGFGGYEELGLGQDSLPPHEDVPSRRGLPAVTASGGGWFPFF
jgi:hypothetical protein